MTKLTRTRASDKPSAQQFRTLQKRCFAHIAMSTSLIKLRSPAHRHRIVGAILARRAA
jgi:hypothetical protein